MKMIFKLPSFVVVARLRHGLLRGHAGTCNNISSLKIPVG